MTAVPSYSAARAGVLGDPGAIDTSASINQLLGAHPATIVYTGSEILTPTGSGGAPSSLNLGTADWDQPFTMSGTTVGRVVIPVAPVGAGADLTISLCTDSSGSPASVIVSTRIAAKALAALVATASLTAGSASPLATAASNSLTSGPGQMVPYSSPAVTAYQSVLNYSGIVTAGNNLLLVGGEDSTGAAAPSVLSISYAGGTTLSPAVPQPSLPQGLIAPAVAATPDTLVVAGGSTITISGGTGTPTPQSTVYTASLNTATGAVGAWSPQTQLPQPVFQPAVASSGETVYVVGGTTTGLAGLNTVYWATVQNGQISSWNTGPAFPIDDAATLAAVVNGFLVVACASAGPTDTIYYAAIHSDGSLGAWQTGPTIPYFRAPLMTGIPGAGLAFFDYIPGSSITPLTETLAFGANGPAGTFQYQKNGIPVAVGPPLSMAAFPTGNGSWQLFGLYNNQYWTQTLSLVPAVSVALPATGLTNGGTYHVVLSQQGGDAADYLLAGSDQAVFPGNPTARSRARSGGSGWTAATPAGTAIPIRLSNQAAGGQPLHTWVDGGAQHGTLVYTTTPDHLLLGLIDQNTVPAPVLNAASTFVGGLGPWTVAGGTATTSNAQVHGKLPLSAQITPSGTAATAGIESEQQPVFQGHSYVATAWAYSAVGYATATVNLRWYNAGGLMSTTTGTVTALPAGVWTQLSVTGAVPAGALYATVQVVEGGTPPATAVYWVSAAPLRDVAGAMLASVAQITYPGTWPGQAWPPTGVVQLN